MCDRNPNVARSSSLSLFAGQRVVTNLGRQELVLGL